MILIVAQSSQPRVVVNTITKKKERKAKNAKITAADKKRVSTALVKEAKMEKEKKRKRETEFALAVCASFASESA
jgi:hypothetical protein